MSEKQINFYYWGKNLGMKYHLIELPKKDLLRTDEFFEVLDYLKENLNDLKDYELKFNKIFPEDRKKCIVELLKRD